MPFSHWERVGSESGMLCISLLVSEGQDFSRLRSVSLYHFVTVHTLSANLSRRDHGLQLRWGPEREFSLSRLEVGNRQQTLAAFLHGKCAGPEENSLSKHFRTTRL